MLVSRDAVILGAPEIKPFATVIAASAARVWSDDFSDLIEYLE